MKLTKIADNDSHQCFASGPWTEADWPLSFLVVLEYTDYYDEEWARTAGPYNCMIQVASPEAAASKLAGIKNNYCLDDEAWNSIDFRNQCEILRDNGVCATLWQMPGKNKASLLKQAREELRRISFLFGFYMDKPQNRIGDTGWDWIQGNVCASLDRHREKIEQEGLNEGLD